LLGLNYPAFRVAIRTKSKEYLKAISFDLAIVADQACQNPSPQLGLR
jgi:hypothetical protein